MLTSRWYALSMLVEPLRISIFNAVLRHASIFISLSVVKVAAQVAISGSDLWRRSFRCQSVILRLTFLQSVCSVWVANHTKVPGRKQRPRRLGVVSLISTFRFSAFFHISIIPFLHFSFLFAFSFCSSLASDVFAFQGLLEIAVCQVHLQCFSWSKTRLNAILEPYWNQSQVLLLAFSFCFNHLKRHMYSEFLQFLEFLLHVNFVSLLLPPILPLDQALANCQLSLS